jgi:hypothetical protein
VIFLLKFEILEYVLNLPNQNWVLTAKSDTSPAYMFYFLNKSSTHIYKRVLCGDIFTTYIIHSSNGHVKGAIRWAVKNKCLFIFIFKYTQLIQNRKIWHLPNVVPWFRASSLFLDVILRAVTWDNTRMNVCIFMPPPCVLIISTVENYNIHFSEVLSYRLGKVRWGTLWSKKL